MNTIFESDIIKVSETGQDYDFIATVYNKTNNGVFFSNFEYETKIKLTF